MLMPRFCCSSVLIRELMYMEYSRGLSLEPSVRPVLNWHVLFSEMRGCRMRMCNFSYNFCSALQRVPFIPMSCSMLSMAGLLV